MPKRWDFIVKSMRRERAVLKNFVVFSTFTLAVPVCASTVPQSQYCQNYIGRTVVPETFTKAVAALPALTPKGKYETSEAYASRVAARDNMAPIVILKYRNLLSSLEYDADTSTLTVSKDFFGEYATKGAESLAFNVIASFKPRLYFVASQEIKDRGNYRARAAIGVPFNVHKSEKVLGIVSQPDETETNNTDLFFSASYRSEEDYSWNAPKNLGTLSIAPADAAVVVPRLRPAYVVRPVPPFKARDTMGGGIPSLIKRHSQSEDTTVMFADIQCALLLDGTKVLASYTTR